MSLFVKSDVTMLQKRISELELSLDTSIGRVSELEKENMDYKSTISNFHLSTEKYDKQIDMLKKQHELQIVELNKKLAETENSVNKKVNKELQKIGVSNFLIEIPIELKNSKDIYQQFLSMPNGSKKTEFFNHNEKAIREGMSVPTQIV